jgi:hypothetical protein
MHVISGLSTNGWPQCRDTSSKTHHHKASRLYFRCARHQRLQTRATHTRRARLRPPSNPHSLPIPGHTCAGMFFVNSSIKENMQRLHHASSMLIHPTHCACRAHPHMHVGRACRTRHILSVRGRCPCRLCNHTTRKPPLPPQGQQGPHARTARATCTPHTSLPHHQHHRTGGTPARALNPFIGAVPSLPLPNEQEEPRPVPTNNKTKPQGLLSK